MTYVKIGENRYEATILGKLDDKDWDNRSSKTINLEMTHDEACELFVDDVVWSIIVVDEEGQETEYDNSEYKMAGDITDHRDGNLSVKMGKMTDLEEAYEIMYGPINGGAE